MFDSTSPPAVRVKAPEGPRTNAHSAPPRGQLKQPKKKPFYVFKYSKEDPDYIREIVQSVANGLEASQISPELFPVIIKPLCSQELNLRMTNPSASLSLHNAIEYIYNWKPEEEIDPNLVNQREDVYLPSPEMISAGVNLALEDGDLFSLDPQLLQFLIGPLREIRLSSLESCDYKRAQKAERGARNVIAQQVLQQKIEEQDEKISESQQRLEVAQIQLENVKEKWQILIDQKKDQMETDIKTRQKSFNLILNEFDKQFEQEPPQKVLKVSPGLLDLRAREKSLVSSKRFDEAKKMRKLAREREKLEIEQRKRQYYIALTKEREKLVEKENQKDFVCRMSWQSTISQMQLNANKEILHAQKTVEHLIILSKSLDNNAASAEGGASDGVNKPNSQKLPPLNIQNGKTKIETRVNTVR